MTVELFLAIPIVIVVLVASIQVVGMARARVELQGAVRDGARVAATTPDPSKAVEAVLNALPPAAADVTRVSVERPSVVGAVASVTATMRYRLGVPFPDDFGIELTAHASMITER